MAVAAPGPDGSFRAPDLQLVWSVDDEPRVGGTEAEIIAWHVQDLRLRNLRESTIYQRKRVLARLRKSIARPLIQATHRDLARFLARPVRPESRAVETTHVRQFYEWCIDEELLETSPARRLRRPRVPRRHPDPISEPDLAMAIDLSRPRLRPWYLLGAFAGLRACEVAQLRVDDIRWSDEVPHIIIREGKGGHAGAVAMSSYLATELHQCGVGLSGWIAPRLDGKPGHLPAHMVSRLANDHLHALGITHTFHKLRHRFGTQVLRSSGGNVRTAQEALRHMSIRSTQEYTKVEMTDVAAAVEGLPHLHSMRNEAA
jgi:integrase/recombinase XerD